MPLKPAILFYILSDDYRVTFATSGPGALTAAQAQPRPGLILLDVMMPDMDGSEVCRRLKADLRTRDIPVIFLTAQNDVNNEEYGLKMGVVDYLHKPCHPAIVLQRVRIHLELHNQNLALEDRVQERTKELDDHHPRRIDDHDGSVLQGNPGSDLDNRKCAHCSPRQRPG